MKNMICRLLRVNSIIALSFFVSSCNYQVISEKEDKVRWTCVNKDNGNFTTVFEIDKGVQKSIKHISSYNPRNDKTYKVDLPVEIISSDSNKVFATKNSQMQAKVNFYVFHLDQMLYTQSGHYLSSPMVGKGQVFKCY